MYYLRRSIPRTKHRWRKPARIVRQVHEIIFEAKKEDEKMSCRELLMERPEPGTYFKPSTFEEYKVWVNQQIDLMIKYRYRDYAFFKLLNII